MVILDHPDGSHYQYGKEADKVPPWFTVNLAFLLSNCTCIHETSELLRPKNFNTLYINAHDI